MQHVSTPVVCMRRIVRNKDERINRMTPASRERKKVLTVECLKINTSKLNSSVPMQQ
ncbi:MAG: hypothetical protein ABJB86_19970 [Bacteroidota bacterium]